MADTAVTTAPVSDTVANRFDRHVDKDKLKKFADFLRGKNGPKTKDATMQGKRVEYVKGDKLVAYLCKKDYAAKDRPEQLTKAEGTAIGSHLLKNSYIHKAVRHPEQKKELFVTKPQTFELDGFYVWMYEGSTSFKNLMTGALIATAIALTLFPLWPQSMKVVIWYISVTFLVFMMVFIVVRLLLFFVGWILGYEFWVLPNVFDDDATVSESFDPYWSFEPTGEGQMSYRIGSLVFVFSIGYYIANQPTDWDVVVDAQYQFMSDLYSGNLLSDSSQEDKDNIDKVIPTVEELLSEMEEDDEDMNNLLDSLLDNEDDADEDYYE